MGVLRKYLQMTNISLQVTVLVICKHIYTDKRNTHIKIHLNLASYKKMDMDTTVTPHSKGRVPLIYDF